MAVKRTEAEIKRIEKMLRGGESLRSDGRFQYRYTDCFGKRKYMYASTLSELREKERILAEKQKAGLIGGTENISLNTMYDKYIEGRRNLKNSTLVNYNYLWDKYVRNSFGKMKIEKILYSNIYDFYLNLHEEQGLQVNTLESIHGLIHPALELAVKNKLIISNPSSGVMRSIKEATNWESPKRKAVNERDLEEFMLTITSNPIFYKWYDFFIILFGTGLRIGEMIGLTWDDVDLVNKELNINHQLVYRSVNGTFTHYISTPKKKKSYRTVPITEEVEEAFKRLKAKEDVAGSPKLELYGNDGKLYSGFIFYNTEQNFHTPTSINRSIKAICKWTNERLERIAKQNESEFIPIEEFSCHCARHTFCSDLCRSSDSIHDLQCIMAIMGHQSIDTTIDIYAEVTGRDKSKFMEKIKQSKSLKVS